MKTKQKIRSFLKKTEKYTKIDNIYLAKGGFWLGFAHFSTMAIAIVMAVIWARFVPKEIYGQYKFVLSFVELFAIFTLTGMEHAMIGAVARGFEGTAKKMTKMRIKFSSLALVASFGLALYYFLNQNNVLAFCFFIVGIFSPIAQSLSSLTKYLEGKKRFDLGAKFAVIKTLIEGILMAAAILLTKNIVFLIFVYFSSRFALNILFAFLTFKFVPANNKIEKEAISFGKHLSFVSILSRLASQLDKILVFHYLGAVELAVYSFSTMIPDNLNGFSKIIQQLISPKLAVRNKQEIKQNIKEKTQRLFLALTLIVFFYVISAPVIFRIFFPNYQEAVFFSQIYCFGLLAGVSLIPEASFIVKNKTKVIYIKNIVFSLSRILFIFLGLYFFGFLGLIIALILERYTQAIANFSLLKYL